MSEAVARKLFDHLVGAGKEGGWDRQTDLLRSLQIDDQFEPSRLLDGQLGRFASFEDFRDIVGALLGQDDKAIGAIGRKARSSARN